MQVGCEEEGIPEVWQQILGYDMLHAGPSAFIQILVASIHVLQTAIQVHVRGENGECLCASLLRAL